MVFAFGRYSPDATKNAIEFKHCIVHDVFLRLQNPSQKHDECILIRQKLCVTRYLYGNSTARAHEHAQGYNRPFTTETPIHVPKEMFDAQNELKAKRKLSKLPLRSLYARRLCTLGIEHRYSSGIKIKRTGACQIRNLS